MTPTPLFSIRLSRHARAGSILPLALATITVLAVIASGVLVFLGKRFDSGMQTTRWQQALSSAEAGVEMAIGTLVHDATLQRSNQSTTAAWTGWTRNKTAVVGGTTYTYDEAVMTDTDTPDRRTVVQVDKIGSLMTTGGRQWYRVRSMGTVTLPRISRASNDLSDIRLRKVGLGTDWAAGRLFGTAQVNLAPRQASRVVEALLEPVSPFQFALFAVNSLSFDHMIIDSYDSSDTANPSRMTPGTGGAKGQRGNVGSNATSGVAISSKALSYVWGNAYTNGASMQSWQQRVRWEYRTNVNTRTPSITAAPFTVADRTVATGSAVTVSIPASANSWSTAYKVQYSGAMTLNGSHKLTFNNGGGQYAIVYVNGDMSVASGNNILVIPSGVRVKFYANGNINIRGASVNMPSKKPGDFIVYGMKAPAGTPAPRGTKGSSGTVRTLNVESTIAAIYAPDHDAVSKANNDSMIGSLIARNIDIRANPHTEWHFDEALLQEDTETGYNIVNWVEDAWTANNWYTAPRAR